MCEIQLVQVGGVERCLLEILADVFADSLSLRCVLREAVLDVAPAYDRERGQYNSTAILAELLGLDGPPHRKVLGVTGVDLFIPILTFVFGEAQLGGRAAVVSTCRLRQEFYGLPEDEELLCQRLEKEAVHEIGHTFGLIHCPSPDCVMHSSNSVEDVDIKPSSFCGDCAAWWRQRTRNSEPR